MKEIIDSKREKKPGSLGSESKAAAYKLLNGLLRRDQKLMDYFLGKCLGPLMTYIERTECWNYTPPSSKGRN
jgi:hypothetical protein